MLTVLASLSVGCRSTQPELQHVEALTEHARAADAAGDYGLAVENWNLVRRIDPAHSPEAHLGLSRALAALRELDPALAALEYGIEFFPDDTQLRRVRGHLLAELGLLRAAEADLAFVCNVLPDDALAWCELARLRAELGFLESAAETFDRALAIEGCPPQAELVAARVHDATFAFERAHTLYASSVERAGEDVLLLAEASEQVRGWLAADVAEVDEPARAAAVPRAIEWARRACQLDPQHTAAHVTLGVLLESRGDLEGALEPLRRAVEVDNFDVDAITRLARMHAALGRRAEALAFYDRALALPIDEVLLETLLAEREELAAQAEAEASTPDAATPPEPDAATGSSTLVRDSPRTLTAARARPTVRRMGPSLDR